MASGLRAFAIKAGSPAQPDQPQPTASQRRALVAQNARVQPQDLRSTNAARHPLREPRQTRNIGLPAPRPVVAGSNLVKTTGRGDRYDTDAESFDEPITVSDIQVLDSQVDSRDRPYIQHLRQESNYGDDEQDPEEYTEDDENEDGEGDAGEYAVGGGHHQGFPLHATVPGLNGLNADQAKALYMQSVAAIHQQQQSRGLPKLDPSINSYPSTTTGLPVEAEQDHDGGEEYEDEQTEHGGNDEDESPQRNIQQQSLERPLEAYLEDRANNTFAQRSVFQPGAVREQITQAQPTLTLRQNPLRTVPAQPQMQERASLTSESHAPKLSRVPNEPVAQDYYIPLSTTVPLQSRPSNGQATPHQAPEADQPESILDYEPKILDQKPYSELHDEPFDYNPAQPAPVLPDELLDSSVDQRLEYVHGLDLETQQKFFASLTMSEWEDAGDWFLEQFSVILKSTRAAREERRKIAAGFEEEVFKRNEHIAKRKRGIDEALEGMKMSGRGVLSGTPKKRRT